jgi:hypothetical protein
MKKIGKKRTVHSHLNHAPFVAGGARIWRSKWGSGIAAREGYLITGGLPFPNLIAWTNSFEEARGFLDGKVKLDDIVDLTRIPRGTIYCKIGENLLFPVHLSTGMLDASDDAFAAAHFVAHPSTPNLLAFCILTRWGLSVVTHDIWLAETSHHERSKRKAE